MGTRPYVLVKWGSRIIAFDRTDGVQKIIEKACAHFHLAAPMANDLVLVSKVPLAGGDHELELSDDMLNRLPNGVIVTLTIIPHFCGSNAADEEVMLGQKRLRSDIPAGTGTDVGSMRDSMIKSALRVAAHLPSSHENSTNVTLGDHNGGPISKPATNLKALSVAKPVIYIFPPEPLVSVTVSLRLVPQWTFTYLYPLADTKLFDDGTQGISWNISASPDGSLVESGTGLELSYLFWEAESFPTLPPSPPPSPTRHTEHFDPSSPSLEPATPTAVLLSFAQLLPYLDGALKSLSLHTSARNDFITYWLPKLSKKPFVALRFLPQRAYARAVVLEVEPRPEVVTRVFMLFRGVADEETEMWAAARDRASTVDWTSVVGVDTVRALDATLYRVLEWGAVEVL